MRLITLIFLVTAMQQSEAYNKRLLGHIRVNCEAIAATAPTRIRDKFFDEQHSLAMIDFSNEPLIDNEICENGRVTRAFEVFDDISKVNLGKKIDKSGLSEHPRTLGILIRGTIDQAFASIPVIAKNNPRSKMMIHLSQGTYENAERVLRDCFNNHKMLDVGVMMPFPNKVMIFCAYNPFAGDLNVRHPEFKCWSMKKSTFDETLQPIINFFKDRRGNLQRYPLKVTVYHHPMLAVQVRDKKGIRFGYPDGELINLLSMKMNFTPIYNFRNDKGSDDVKQGYQLPNGSFNGNLGTIESGKADYSINSLLISSSYNTSNVLFVNSMAMDKFLFIIKKRKPSATFAISMYSVYDKTTLNLFCALLVLLPIFYVIITKTEAKLLQSTKKVEFVGSAFYIFAMQANVSMQHRRFHASRMIVASILFLTLIINSIFQGTIISSLNNNQDNGTIKTVDELIAHNYRLIVHHDIKAVLFGLGGRWKKVTSDPNSIMLNFWTGFSAVRENSNVAFLVSTLYTGNFLDLFYDKQTGENLIQEVPEVVFQFFVSPIMPKDSPFVEQFKNFAMQYRESGLRKYQMRCSTHSKERIMIKRLLAGEVPKRNGKTIGLKELRSVFHVTLILLVIAFVVFLLEISLQRIKLLWKGNFGFEASRDANQPLQESTL